MPLKMSWSLSHDADVALSHDSFRIPFCVRCAIVASRVISACVSSAVLVEPVAT
jgi:hypothetical protein